MKLSTYIGEGGMPDGRNIQDVDLRTVPSVRRNPLLADVFNRLGYMERQGSGLGKILDGCKNAENFTKKKSPVFYSNRAEFTLSFRNMNYGVNEHLNELLNEPLKPINKPLRPLNEPINEPINEPLNEPLNHKILKLLASNPTATQKVMVQYLGVSRITIRRELEKMVQNGLIQYVGSKKTGHWNVIKND